ncbi:putative retrovirus-related pol polyprotein from transposon opus [Trichonephila clavipes]|nr:putative retrovirus-related pol polyprotein from transposon opus [Trichonephila clavipes]
MFGENISMANSSIVTETKGVCKVNLKIQNFTYQNVELLVMKDLWSDVLIRHDILNRHSSVEIGFDGNRPALTICSLAVAQVPPVSLFSNLNSDCRPLVTKSRRQTVEDNIFMALKKFRNFSRKESSNQVTHHEGLKPLSLKKKILSPEWWLTTLKN